MSSPQNSSTDEQQHGEQPHDGQPTGAQPQHGQQQYGQLQQGYGYGQSPMAPYSQPPMAPYSQSAYGAGPDIPNYRVWSIVSVVFCGVLGIIALVMSFDVDNRKARGDFIGAQSTSNTVKILCIVGNVLAVISCTFAIIALVSAIRILNHY